LDIYGGDKMIAKVKYEGDKRLDFQESQIK